MSFKKITQNQFNFKKRTESKLILISDSQKFFLVDLRARNRSDYQHILMAVRPARQKKIFLWGQKTTDGHIYARTM